jgi:hypothetical protein
MKECSALYAIWKHEHPATYRTFKLGTFATATLNNVLDAYIGVTNRLL